MSFRGTKQYLDVLQAFTESVEQNMTQIPSIFVEATRNLPKSFSQYPISRKIVIIMLLTFQTKWEEEHPAETDAMERLDEILQNLEDTDYVSRLKQEHREDEIIAYYENLVQAAKIYEPNAAEIYNWERQERLYGVINTVGCLDELNIPIPKEARDYISRETLNFTYNRPEAKN